MWLKQAKEGSLFRQPELRQSSAIRALLIAPALIGSAKSGHSVPLSKLLKRRASRNASFRPVYTHLHSKCRISVANSIEWSQLHIWAGRRGISGNLGLARQRGRAWNCLESSLARRCRCIRNIPVTTFKSTSVAFCSHPIYTVYTILSPSQIPVTFSSRPLRLTRRLSR
jgi:hypothetical protein